MEAKRIFLAYKRRLILFRGGFLDVQLYYDWHFDKVVGLMSEFPSEISIQIKI